MFTESEQTQHLSVTRKQNMPNTNVWHLFGVRRIPQSHNYTLNADMKKPPTLYARRDYEAVETSKLEAEARRKNPARLRSIGVGLRGWIVQVPLFINCFPARSVMMLLCGVLYNFGSR